MPRQTLFNRPELQSEPWPPQPLGCGLLSDEPARGVYKTSCLQIGDALVPHGFKYIRSRQCCTAKPDRFVNEIAFRSSHFNVSGQHVQLWMYATVASPELQAWRAERLPPERATAHVAGGMVHLLGTEFAWLQWELANPSDRQDTIQDAIAFIQANVLPYFGKFEDTASLLRELASAEVPAFDLVSAVEFSYCFGGKRHAQSTLDRFIRDRPDLHLAIEAESASPSPDTLTRPGGYVQQVIYLRHQYGLR